MKCKFWDVNFIYILLLLPVVELGPADHAVIEKSQFQDICFSISKVYLVGIFSFFFILLFPDDIFSEVWVCGNHSIELLGFSLHKAQMSCCVNISFDWVSLAFRADESLVRRVSFIGRENSLLGLICIKGKWKTYSPCILTWSLLWWPDIFTKRHRVMDRHYSILAASTNWVTCMSKQIQYLGEISSQ